MSVPSTLRIATILPLAAMAAVLLFLASSPQGAQAGEFCVNSKVELCVTLTPDPDTNPINTDHTVTAAATFGGQPWDEQANIVFFVVSGPNVGDGDIIPLVQGGTADFTYTGDGGTGTDEITATLCDPSSFCEEILGCLETNPQCIQKVEGSCPSQIIVDTATRVGAGQVDTANFCLGPAYASKTWEEPTPTPSPTPVDLAPDQETPAPTPTPAQLPDTGGSAGGSGSPWLLAALIGAAVLLSSGALALARRSTSAR